jgi:hypothetical protein
MILLASCMDLCVGALFLQRLKPCCCSDILASCQCRIFPESTPHRCMFAGASPKIRTQSSELLRVHVCWHSASEHARAALDGATNVRIRLSCVGSGHASCACAAAKATCQGSFLVVGERRRGPWESSRVSCGCIVRATSPARHLVV